MLDHSTNFLDPDFFFTQYLPEFQHVITLMGLRLDIGFSMPMPLLKGLSIVFEPGFIKKLFHLVKLIDNPKYFITRLFLTSSSLDNPRTKRRCLLNFVQLIEDTALNWYRIRLNFNFNLIRFIDVFLPVFIISR